MRQTSITSVRKVGDSQLIANYASRAPRKARRSVNQSGTESPSTNRRIQSAETYDRKVYLDIHDSLDLQGPASKQEHSKSLVKYQDDLTLLFSRNDDVQRLTLAHLQQTPEYTKWINAGSSLLLLSGRNHPELNTISESWLSEPTLELISNLQSPPSTIDPAPVLAFYLCLATHKHLDILSNILSQLEGPPPAKRLPGHQVEHP